LLLLLGITPGDAFFGAVAAFVVVGAVVAVVAVVAAPAPAPAAAADAGFFAGDFFLALGCR